MDLFAAYGYRGTSLARIARAAGVTKGALYWHFTDKEDFFLAVAERVLDQWSAALDDQSRTSAGSDYAEEFIRAFGTLAELNERNPWVTRLLLIVSLESHKIGPRVLRMIRRRNLRAFDRFRQMVERGKALHALDEGLDSAWAATQISASYLGLANLWYLHGDRFNLRRSLERQARDFLRQWGKAR